MELLYTRLAKKHNLTYSLYNKISKPIFPYDYMKAKTIFDFRGYQTSLTD